MICRANNTVGVYGSSLPVQDLLAWFGVTGSVSQRARPLLRANGVDLHRLYGSMDLGAPDLGTCALSYDITVEVTVADLLIRDVPDDVVVAIDADAQRLGLSRSEYLRRALVRTATAAAGPVTVDDLSRFADTFADLADPEVMRRAWQ